MYLKKLKKQCSEVSFEILNCIDSDGESVTFDKTIMDNSDIEEEFQDQMLKIYLKDYVEELPELEREIIKMNFGFYGRVYNQMEIAKKFQINRSCVSMIEIRILNKLKCKIKRMDNFPNNKFVDFNIKPSITYIKN